MSAASASPLGRCPRWCQLLFLSITERYIAEALDSVLQEDYPALEIIIVDDGFVDSTQNIVRDYGDKVRLAS